MSKSRRCHLFCLTVVGLVMAVAPAGASAALSCPQNLLGFAKVGVTVTLAGPCVSTTVGATVNYDIYHPGTAPHGTGTPHFPAPGILSTLAQPTNGLFGFPAPGVVTYTPTGGAGGTDFWEYAATDDGGASWTVFPVNVQIVALTQTVFSTPPVSPTIPVAASIETTGTTGVSIAGRAPTTAQPPGVMFLGEEYFIQAPAQTVANPLRVTFTIAASRMNPTGGPAVPTPLKIYRNAVEVGMCNSPSTFPLPPGSADPDPCIESRGFVGAVGSSDYRFVVRSSQASVWNIAAPTTADGVFTADVLPTIAISATSAVNFGAVSVGTMALGVPNPASARVTANVPYSLSVARTAFSGGADIPLNLAATAPVGATLAGSVPGFIPTSGSLSVGARTTGVTPVGGEEWSPRYTLGPVPFRAVGPTSSTVTYTVVAP